MQSSVLERFKLELSDRQLSSAPQDSTLASFVAKKSSWEPVALQSKLAQSKLAQRLGKVETLQRCIALGLNLEIPVGELALDGSCKVGDQFTNALLSNACDEETHYTALSLLTGTFPVTEKQLEEANQISQEFQNLGHPILLAGFIELAVFFPILAMLRSFGDTPMKVLSTDISRDEAAHVRVNWHLIDELNLGYITPKLDKLRQDTIQWLVEKLDTSVEQDQDFWHKTSTNLANTRQAPELEFTKSAVFTAFLEVSKENLAYYQAKPNEPIKTV